MVIQAFKTCLSKVVRPLAIANRAKAVELAIDTQVSTLSTLKAIAHEQSDTEIKVCNIGGFA